jgi:hypothetical protein
MENTMNQFAGFEENRVRPDSTAFGADLTVAALRAAAIGRPRASLNIME